MRQQASWFYPRLYEIPLMKVCTPIFHVPFRVQPQTRGSGLASGKPWLDRRTAATTRWR